MHRLSIYAKHIGLPITQIGKFSRDEIVTLIDEMLSYNEANDAAKYALSKVPVGKSGYTFGRCQHDCAYRSDARKLIQKCLRNANVSDEKIENIIAALAKYTLNLSSDELAIVNNALALPDNMKIIDQFDIDHINAAIDHVARVVKTGLTGETGKKVQEYILDDLRVFLQLVDYHNQFYLKTEGPLMKFLNGESVDRNDLGEGKIAKINTHKLGFSLLSETRRFINEYTIYGIQNRKDCIRRQNTIDNLGYMNLRTPYSSSPMRPPAKRGIPPHDAPPNPHFPPPSSQGSRPNSQPSPRPNPPPHAPEKPPLIPMPRPNPVPSPRPNPPAPTPPPPKAPPKPRNPIPPPTTRPGPVYPLPFSLLNAESPSPEKKNNDARVTVTIISRL